PFDTEVQMIQRTLGLRSGDTVLDLACGHGNFTLEWSKLVGSSGLVIGLDISLPMLRRAAQRIAKSGINNVLLINGDALNLPFANACFSKLNCSGGFHKIPHLDRAIAELARVAAPGANLTASMFARLANDPHEAKKRKYEVRYIETLHCISLPQLG